VTIHVDEFTGRGDLSFHSVSGDITLELPRDFGAELSMSTVSGDIDTDFPITLGNGRMSRGHSMNARIGTGGRRLDVATVSGDLRLRSNK
jgi:lia operon protein LiaG